MISKELWVKNIIDDLKVIASEEYQYKGWVRGEIHEYCTFVEAICGLFMDSNFEMFIDEKAKEYGLSDEQIKKLDTLRNALNQYVDEHGAYEDPEKIIRDPKWHQIRKMAQEALHALGIDKYLDPSKDIYRECLLGTIWWITDQESLKCIWENSRDHPLQTLKKDFFGFPRPKMLIEHPKDYEITKEQHQLLKEIYDLLSSYIEKNKDLNKNLEQTLQDPEWQEIQKLAQRILDAFNFKMFG